MKALIIGATGATGKDLVNTLLQDNDYTEIITFVRRGTGVTHPKLTEVLTDFDNLETVAAHIVGDVLFSCLGTTLKAAGSKDNQRHIDFEIPLKFAQIAKRNGVPKVVLLSAYGASATSKVFYSKIKGELEDKMAELAFESYIIFRPGFLLRKNTDRPDERITATLLHIMNRLGLLRKFKPLPTMLLAEKLAKAPKILESGKHQIILQDIFSF